MEQKYGESVSIGGAWKRVSANGKTYISGKLNNDSHFVIFPNTKKVEGSKQPDYRILMEESMAEAMGLLDEYSTRKKQEREQAHMDRASRPGDGLSPASGVQTEVPEQTEIGEPEIDISDIPF